MASSEVNKYNDKGYQTEEDTYGADGALSGKYCYLYNAKGDEIESDDYDASGYLKGKEVFVCDSAGNRIDVKSYITGGRLLYENIYKYDSLGRTIEDDYYTDGTLKDITIIKFDKYGQECGRYINDPAGRVQHSQVRIYDYDSQGNWIKLTGYNSSNTPDFIIERTFTYY